MISATSRTTETQAARSLIRLRLLLFSYMVLLIFEGSVRKWVPGMSTPFLLIRDPIALGVWYLAYSSHVGSRKLWALFHGIFLAVTVLGLVQLMSSTIYPPIIIYGWRSYVLHWPVAIAMGSILTREDIENIGRWALRITPPIVLLMCLQYVSPPTSWINRGTGDRLQITGALGHIRPAGPFSYNAGLVEFLPLVAGFCLWGLLGKPLQKTSRLLSYAVLLSLAVAIPISVSRSLALVLAMVVVSSLVGVMIGSRFRFNPRDVSRLAAGVVIAAVVLIGLSRIELVQDALVTFTTRWTLAQGASGDNSVLVERSLSLFTTMGDTLSHVPLLGVGIGAGSDAAAALQGGRANFAFGESPTDRQFYELGFVLGIVFVGLRYLGAIWYFIRAYVELMRGWSLPWFLIAPVLINFIMAPIDIASQQGFVVISAGLGLASFRAENSLKQE